MSDSLKQYCQQLRSDIFPAGLRPEWLEIDGPSITVTLPFPATQAVKELFRQDSMLKSYRIDVITKVNAHNPSPASKTRMKGPKNIIAVASGKGGVGKSAVSVNLALGLKHAGAKVGILDADIYGPSLPIMMGNQGDKLTFTPNRKMFPLQQYGLELNSLGYLVADDDAAVWRGPMASRALEQLYNDTQWSELDYLIIDMPPGTGDIQLTLAQKIPVTCAVIVTTPQNIALADAQKGIAMFNKVDVPVVGLLENMSYFECSSCGHQEHVFGTEGGDNLAEQSKVPVIGHWPLATRLRESMDAGRPLVETQLDDPLSQQIIHSAQLLAANAWELASIDE